MSEAGVSTTRLDLVPFSDEHLRQLTTLFRDPGVRRYLLDDQLVDEAWVAAEIEASRARFESSGAGLWAAHLKGEASPIGFVGFREFFEPPQLQLLYGLLPSHWGRGLATEAARAICRHAFCILEFDRVDAAIDGPNQASARVLRRLGMRLTHTTRDVGRTDFYSVTREEWMTRSVARMPE